MYNSITERHIKFLSIISYTLLIIALVLFFFNSQSSGYKLSIYNSLPVYFWIFFIFSLITCIITLIISAFFLRNRIWYCSYICILISYIFILLLPIIRGNVLNGRGMEDVLTHIGWAKDILFMGNFYENFYPTTHIIYVNLNFIGFTLESASIIISTYFSILLILLFYVLAKVISNNFQHALFIIAFTVPLLFSYFHVTIHPALFSIFLFPLILYSIHKIEKLNKNIEFKIILFLLILLIVIFHPMTTFILIIVLILFSLLKITKKYFQYNKNFKIINFNFGGVAIIAFILWINSFNKTWIHINDIFRSIFYHPSISIAGSYLSLLNKSNVTTLNLVSITFFSYGQILIYFILSIICIFIVIKNIIQRKIEYFEILYSLQFLVGLGIALLFFFFYFIEFSPIRTSRYAIVIAPILCGIVLYNFIYNIKIKKYRKFSIILIIFIISLVSILGILNIYGSSRVAKANSELTYMENNGLRWFLENRNVNNPLIANGIFLDKIEIYYHSSINLLNKTGKFYGMIPTHFGYDKNNTLSKSFQGENIYMITNEFSRINYKVFPEEVQSKTHHYLRRDIIKLNKDNTVLKIYENNEFESWLVGI